MQVNNCGRDLFYNAYKENYQLVKDKIGQFFYKAGNNTEQLTKSHESIYLDIVQNRIPNFVSSIFKDPGQAKGVEKYLLNKVGTSYDQLPKLFDKIYSDKFIATDEKIKKHANPQHQIDKLQMQIDGWEKTLVMNNKERDSLDALKDTNISVIETPITTTDSYLEYDESTRNIVTGLLEKYENGKLTYGDLYVLNSDICCCFSTYFKCSFDIPDPKLSMQQLLIDTVIKRYLLDTKQIETHLQNLKTQMSSLK